MRSNWCGLALWKHLHPGAVCLGCMVLSLVGVVKWVEGGYHLLFSSLRSATWAAHRLPPMIVWVSLPCDYLPQPGSLLQSAQGWSNPPVFTPSIMHHATFSSIHLYGPIIRDLLQYVVDHWFTMATLMRSIEPTPVGGIATGRPQLWAPDLWNDRAGHSSGLQMVTLMTAPPEHSGPSINCRVLPRPPLGLQCMSWGRLSGGFEGLDMITGQRLQGPQESACHRPGLH